MNIKSEQVRHYILNSVKAALAEADGQNDEAELLRACNISLLVAMSDEEIHEVSRVVSCPPSRSEEVIYDELSFLSNHFKTNTDQLMEIRITDESVTMSIN